MTAQQIKDGNKMIAEFMRMKITEVVYERNERIIIDKEFCFNNFWDLLMPVVEKIERMDGHFTIGTNKIECQFQDFRGSSKVGFGYTKIQCVWEVIVEFIKWYNTQNPKQ